MCPGRGETGGSVIIKHNAKDKPFGLLEAKSFFALQVSDLSLAHNLTTFEATLCELCVL